MHYFTEVIERIKEEEGFDGMAYRDTTGNWTIGYGTKLPISEDEAELLLNSRLVDKLLRITADEHLSKIFFKVNDAGKVVLLDMSYNLGIKGLKGFKKMLKAMEEGNFKEAADEMLDSLWAAQVKGRALRLADIMRNAVKFDEKDS